MLSGVYVHLEQVNRELGLDLQLLLVLEPEGRELGLSILNPPGL